MRHALPFVGCRVPAACAPALAATFPDVFAPHPGPKTSGLPAWPWPTPELTPDRPTHKYTQVNMHKHTRDACTHRRPHTTHSHRHGPRCAHTSTTGKERKREETEIFGLPQ